MSSCNTKIKINIIDECKRLDYYFIKDFAVLNLNVSIPRNTSSFSRLRENITEILQVTNFINLCNFATLCFKLGVDYGSNSAIELFDKIIDNIFDVSSDVIFCQNAIYNVGDIDIKPILTLAKKSSDGNTIWVHPILPECLSKLGFLECQLGDLFTNSISLDTIIPSDMLRVLPINSNRTQVNYEKMMEKLKC